MKKKIYALLTVRQYCALRGDPQKIDIYAWANAWQAKGMDMHIVRVERHAKYQVEGEEDVFKEFIEFAKENRGWRNSTLNDAINRAVRVLTAALEN